MGVLLPALCFIRVPIRRELCDPGRTAYHGLKADFAADLRPGGTIPEITPKKGGCPARIFLAFHNRLSYLFLTEN
jgi:hypothetical protein